jgi:ankyrin repeat protein
MATVAAVQISSSARAESIPDEGLVEGVVRVTAIANSCSGTMDDQIWDLCRRGDIDGLRDLRRRGVRVVGADPLCKAAFYGAPLAVLRVLVRVLGADVNGRDVRGCTATFLAAQKGHVTVVQYLVKELDADVNCAHKGISPLHVACHSGQFDVVRCLVKFRADINQASREGITPRMTAVMNGHADVAAWLESRGAYLTEAEPGPVDAMI